MRRSRSQLPPLIGVVTHELRPEVTPSWAPAPGRSERDMNPPRLSLRLSYMQAVQEAGAIAVVLPAHGYVDDIAPLLDRMDGLLFSGGPDLDPATYGQERHPLLGPDTDRVSDEYELEMLRQATARDLPILAICRGMQALNVVRGGTLHQHLPDLTRLDHRQTQAPFETTHSVTVRAGSPLHRLTRRRGLEVNSFHHQAIDELGERLVPCAHAPDGTIEALYDPALRFCLGVQWHAEALTHRAEHAPLLRELVAAAVHPAATPLRAVS
ncbi:MAG TPA: gamma-glutamyl-gamma-aminobutyrate hydrolase family protein [Solirubrobacter sp.]